MESLRIGNTSALSKSAIIGTKVQVPPKNATTIPSGKPPQIQVTNNSSEDEARDDDEHDIDPEVNEEDEDEDEYDKIVNVPDNKKVQFVNQS